MSGPEELDRRPSGPTTRAVRALRRFEPGRPAYQKGVRAGLALGAAMVIGLAVGNEGVAILAAMGALNCVMADTADVALRRRVLGLAVAVTANAGALTLGFAVGTHLWSALLVMAPLAFLAGLAGCAGQQGSAVGLTTAVVYMVGLGLAGAGATTSAGAVFLESLLGGLGAIVVVTVEIPPDPLGPARRSVAGALQAVAEVFATLGSSEAATGPRPERAAGLGRVARQRLAAGREVVEGSHPVSRSRSGDLEELRALLEVGSGLLVHSEALAVLMSALGQDSGAHPAATCAREAAAALAESLREVASALRSRRAPTIPRPPAERCGAAVGALEAETERLRGLRAVSGEPEAVRQAIDRLAVVRSVEQEWRATLSLLAAPPAGAPAAGLGPDPLSELSERLRRNLTPRSALARRSAQFAVTAMVGYAIGQQLGLDKAYWVTLTIAVILQPAAAPSLDRAFLRLSGTIAGSVLGAVLLATIRDRNGLVAAIAILAALTFSLMRVNYALGVTFLTPLVLTIVSVPHPGDWALAVTRIEATALGAGLVIVSGLVLWPGAARFRIVGLLARALSAEHRYLDAAWEGLEAPGATVIRRVEVSRRDAALLADNAEADLDRWLGDLPRRREELGLLWSLTDVVRSVHLDVGALAARALEGGRPPPPPVFDRAARSLGRQLEQLALALAALGSRRPTAGRPSDPPPAAEDPLEPVHDQLARIEAVRVAEIVAGESALSPAGRAVRDLRVLEMALQRIEDSVRRARDDVGALSRV